METLRIAVIGDEDTVSGFLLAGVGDTSQATSNFLTVTKTTVRSQIEDAFRKFTSSKDIGIVLINQHIADDIRHLVDDYEAMIPTVMEIPSKERPYDPNSDYIMKRVNMFLGR